MTHRSRSLASWRAPRTPADCRHHALVRDADPSVFDAVVRRLRQRLYRGRVTPPERSELGLRCATMHQGAWCTPRKHVWLVAQPSANGRIDLWLAGAGIHAGGTFASEFARLVADTEALCDPRPALAGGSGAGSAEHAHQA